MLSSSNNDFFQFCHVAKVAITPRMITTLAKVWQMWQLQYIYIYIYNFIFLVALFLYFWQPTII
jgi:hypothetical protein